MKLGRHSTAVPCDTKSRACSASSVATQASLGSAAFGEYSIRLGARASAAATAIVSEAFSMLTPAVPKRAHDASPAPELGRKCIYTWYEPCTFLGPSPAHASKAGST